MTRVAFTDHQQGRPMLSELPEFKMPLVEIGDIVWFYPGGVPGGRPQPMMVDEVHQTTIDGTGLAYYGLGTPRLGVMHCDDPRFIRWPERRKQGAWMHTRRHQQLLDNLQELLERVAALEALLSGNPASPREVVIEPEHLAGLTDQELRETCLKLGISVSANAKRKTIIRRIADYELLNSEDSQE